MAKRIKLTNSTYIDDSCLIHKWKDTGNRSTLDGEIENLHKEMLRKKYVSGDSIKTTTIAVATFTGAYQAAYLVCIPISCASGSAEDTGLVIFKARSSASATSLSYGIEKTNSANVEIVQNGNQLNFNIKQTIQWRYLHCIILAKSDNVELKI